MSHPPRPLSRTRPVFSFTLCLLVIIAVVSLKDYVSHATGRGSEGGTPAAGNQTKSGANNSMPQAANRQPGSADKIRISESLNKLPLRFEVNRGQTTDEVKFLSHGRGYNFYLTATEAIISLHQISEINKVQKLKEDLKRREAREKGEPLADATLYVEEETGPGAVIRMKLDGANTQAQVEGLDELEGKVNYFKGADPQKWLTDVQTFARVKYTGVYPGVDMVYYGNQQQLEYDFLVAPGADPNVIALNFEGADRVEVDKQGNLVLHAGGKQVRQMAPVVYQEVEGENKKIEGRYVIRERGKVGFEVDVYDRNRPLVIDPVLVYSTYFGGVGTTFGQDIAVDDAGNAYITGYAIDVPAVNPYQATSKGDVDVYVAKLNPAGTALIYSTFIGGPMGDFGSAIDIDTAGSAYVAGFTYSGEPLIEPRIDNQSLYYPTTVGAFRRFPVWTDRCNQPYPNNIPCPPYNGITTKLSPAGNSLVYSSYHGTFDSMLLTDIAVDNANQAAITGWSYLATNLGSSTRVVIDKIKADGSGYVFATLDEKNGKYGESIALDTQGNVYVTGDDGSYGHLEPTPGAFQQTYNGYEAFVTKLNTAGNVVYRTFLGGTGADGGAGIAVDTQGNAYITGHAGPGFPILNAVQPTHAGGGDSIHGGDAYVTKLNAAGSALIYSTYLGGSPADATSYSGLDAGYGIAVDTAGNAYVTGETASNNFKTTADGAQKTYKGGKCGTSQYACPDAFATKLSAAGNTILYSSYLGGTQSDIGVNIAVDPNGNFYVVGHTDSTDFMTANPFQATNKGGLEAFVAKFGTAAPPPVTFEIGGKITVGAAALVGATVTLNTGAGGTQTATTDGNGNYKFANLAAGGNYTVTPSMLGYTFTPANRVFNNLTANQTAANFAATAANFEIGGNIADGAAAAVAALGTANAVVSGVTVNLTGSRTATTTTDANGNFKFTNLPAGGNYTVTPSKANYAFTPASRDFNNLTANQTTASFTGTASYSISGKIALGATTAGIAGVTVTLAGGTGFTPRTFTTLADGLYSFANLPAGRNYSVTPTKTYHTFNPVNKTLTALSANQTGVNFAGTLQTYTIGGKITDGTSTTGLAGVTVKITGGTGFTARTFTTLADGLYSFAGLPAGGSYTVTPTKTNYAFNPQSRTYNTLSANQTAANFTSSISYSISGKVLLGTTTALSGVTVTLTGTRTATATTNSLGDYTFTGLPAGGNYTVTPSKVNYTFTPVNRVFTALSANQTAMNFAATLRTYTISGKITVGSVVLSGVTVTLMGTRTLTTTTNSLGVYSFAALPAGGNYTVTPTHVNFTFTPVNRVLTALSANQTTANFAGTRKLYSISGKVLLGTTTALSGVTVALTGSSTATATTDSSGNYSFTNLPAGGNYTVTPSKVNYTFTPVNRAFTALSANQTAMNFAATLRTYTISGKIAVGTTGLSGVVVTLTGTRTLTTTTNSLGVYSFASLPGGGNYTVTPSHVNFTFSPVNKTFNALGASQTTANFAGTRRLYTISGKVSVGSTGLSGVTVTLAGSSAATTTTNSLGEYSFTGALAGGNYTVTPSKVNYTFNPVNKAFTALNASQSNVNFAATLKTYTISGKVSIGTTTTGLGGVTMTLTGGAGFTPLTVNTNADGTYSFTNVPGGGTYIVKPSILGYVFNPASRTYTALSASQTTANFSGTAVNYSIGGKVTQGTTATGLSGVTVNLTGSVTASTTTDSMGNYSFASVPVGGNYTVTPSKSNHTFTPANRTFNNLAANQTAANFSGVQDFTITATPEVIAGGNVLTVTWSASTVRTTSDRISFYKVGTPDSVSSLAYQFIAGGTSGTLTFEAPYEEGQYEFRYYANSISPPVVVSNIITVSGSNVTVSASPSSIISGQSITASWTAQTARSTSDIILLCTVGSTTCWDWKYAGGGTAGSVTFTRGLAAGQYEFRYQVYGTTSLVVATSNAITVTP